MNLTFAMFHIILILPSVVLNPFLPEELTKTIHFSFFPSAFITFSIEPSISSKTFELIIDKLSFIMFRVFGFSDVLIQEVRIF